MMNIDNLTNKQKANRTYYAANADKIREKKRQQYLLKVEKQRKFQPVRIANARSKRIQSHQLAQFRQSDGLQIQRP